MIMRRSTVSSACRFLYCVLARNKSWPLSPCCCPCHNKYSTLLNTRSFKVLQNTANYSTCVSQLLKNMSGDGPSVPMPQLDWKYLLDPQNELEISTNIKTRKGVGSIEKVLEFWERLNVGHITEVSSADLETSQHNEPELWEEMIKEALQIPNLTHPDVPLGDESNARLLEEIRQKPDFDFKPKSVEEIGKALNALVTNNLIMTTGRRSYYLMDAFADLEQALIRFALDKVLSEGFRLISVPDLIHPSVLEACGFRTTGRRSQIYRLNPQRHGDICLSGTAELALAGYFMNETIPMSDLPQKVASVSRCYRAETGVEKDGLYRVHHFTKVEMFAVTSPEDSARVMEEILKIQKDIFSNLELHCRVLDMPTHDLGSPAYRKYDIEAWMPESNTYGELSSTSNCLDYQSRRLNIKTSSGHFAHTVNGTACAIPRTIKAIAEQLQLQDGENYKIHVPSALTGYINRKYCEDSKFPGLLNFRIPEMPLNMMRQVHTKLTTKKKFVVE